MSDCSSRCACVRAVRSRGARGGGERSMEHVHESRRGNLDEKAKTAKKLMQHAGLSLADIRETFHLDGKRAGR